MSAVRRSIVITCGRSLGVVILIQRANSPADRFVKSRNGRAMSLAGGVSRGVARSGRLALLPLGDDLSDGLDLVLIRVAGDLQGHGLVVVEPSGPHRVFCGRNDGVDLDGALRLAPG